MAGTFDKSANLWRRVSSLRPTLHSDITVRPLEYRSVRWYLILDKSSGRNFRINARAFELVGRLDGVFSIGEIVDSINQNRPVEECIEIDEALTIIAHLHAVSALKSGLPLGLPELLSRYKTSQRLTVNQSWANPLAIKLPVFDPDRWLDKLTSAGRCIFTVSGFCIWLTIVCLAILAALLNQEKLLASMAAVNFSGSQIMALWLLYPCMKALHELAHGLAIKAWGGEVHEAGFMFLLFMPVPYVDASSSWAFRDRRKRALVAAAGIMAELAIAAAGLFIWLSTEPGIVNLMGLTLVLVGGLSTLLYNGNPLLKFDGYYVLEDLVQIPNLAQRSARFYVYLIQRLVFGLKDAQSPVTAKGERKWFITYGFLSPMYRLLVLMYIALYLSSHYLIAGIALALWAVHMQIGRPLYKAFWFLANGKQFQQRRARVHGVCLVFAVMLTAALFVPVPLVSRIEGVVWLHEDSHVYTQTAGVVDQALVRSGAHVKKGEKLLLLHNDELQLQLHQARHVLQELQTQRYVALKTSRAKEQQTAADIDSAKAVLAQLQAQEKKLTIVSPGAGQIVFKDPHVLKNKHVSLGDTLGYIITDEQPMVRAVIDQSRVHLMQRESMNIELMLADQMGREYAAELVHEVPAGSTTLPSQALGQTGGGKIPVSADNQNGINTTSEVYQFDLRITDDAVPSGLGTRAYVRLVHGRESLWKQWSRIVRQVLINWLPA